MNTAIVDQHFHNVVRMYSGYVFTITWRMLGNESDAENAARETFVNAYEHFSEYDESRDMKNWLCTIALNTAREMYHKSKHGDKKQSRIPADEIPEISETTTLAHNHLNVPEMIANLDIRYRSVVILYYMQKYSIKEISTMLKESEKVIQSRLYRARKILTREYGDSVL